jgi:hypothetical protein
MIFGIPQSQIRKSWTHTAIANPQISEVCQSAIRKFAMINPQIRKIPWCPSPQTANPQICKVKSIVSIQIRIGLPNTFLPT